MKRMIQLGLGFAVAACMCLSLALLGPAGVLGQTVDSAELRDWERKDSSTTCDEIGSNSIELYSSSPNEEDLMHHGACVGSLYYVAMCGTFEGDGFFFEPTSSELWIACLVIAGNTGNDDKSVSMFDFSLLGANGRKYDQDFTAQASLNADRMFPTATLRQDQTVDGVVAFAAPKSSQLPYALEIDPMLDFSLTGSEPGYIVIPKLVSLESFLGI